MTETSVGSKIYVAFGTGLVKGIAREYYPSRRFVANVNALVFRCPLIAVKFVRLLFSSYFSLVV